MKTPSAELMNRVQEYATQHGNRLYAPIAHPSFASFGYRNGPERFEMIAPHLEFPNGTVLDIGSHWGYIAHRMEDLGYHVTAVDPSLVNIYFMTELRDLSDKKFKIVANSVFNLTEVDYDIVFALNIFHHFLKTEKMFRQFDHFLGRLKCRMMIYEVHSPAEPQMVGAYRNLSPIEAARFVADKLSLSKVTSIGKHRHRELFKLTA